MSIMPPDPDSKTGHLACTSMGCPNPGTVTGIYDDGDVRERVTYCAECAGHLYQEFTPEDSVEYDCGHHSWAGLMALLDQHWPEDIFPTLTHDDVRRDAGARIISLMRWVDQLRGAVR